VLVTATPSAPGVISWPAGPCDIHWHQGQTIVSVCRGQAYDLFSDESQRMVLQVFALVGVVTFVLVSLPVWCKPQS
jgi:hypothetical protein